MSNLSQACGRVTFPPGTTWVRPPTPLALVTSRVNTIISAMHINIYIYIYTKIYIFYRASRYSISARLSPKLFAIRKNISDEGCFVSS